MSTFWSCLSILSLFISTKHLSIGLSDETYGKRNFFCRRMELKCDIGEKVKVQRGLLFVGRYIFKVPPVCFCDECPIHTFKFIRGSNFTSEEINLVKERCEDKTNCSVDPRLISRINRMRLFGLNITYTCQPDTGTGKVTIDSSSEIKTTTNFRLLGVNSSTTTCPDRKSQEFSVHNYLAGLGTGIVLIGLSAAVLCFVLVRRQRLKDEVISPISKDNPTYAGLTGTRVSNIYDVVDAKKVTSKLPG